MLAPANAGGRVIERIYTVEEAAEVLRISPLTVRRYLREGKLGGFKVGRDWRTTESDLQEFIQRARRETRGGTEGT